MESSKFDTIRKFQKEIDDMRKKLDSVKQTKDLNRLMILQKVKQELKYLEEVAIKDLFDPTSGLTEDHIIERLKSIKFATNLIIEIEKHIK